MTDTSQPTPSEANALARLEQRYGPGNTAIARRPPVPNAATTVSSLWSWKAVGYVFILGFASLLLVPLTDLWWIVPLLGAATPVALIAAACCDGGHAGAEPQRAELLAAVAAHGLLTPADAARLTSCTAVEAAHLMEILAKEGVLSRLSGGRAEPIASAANAPSAALTPGDGVSTADVPAPEPNSSTPFVLEEPLSDRELEVLTLLAAGRTNAEAARDLFISVGTVKSHTGNIYRKLDAKNRTEAIARARQAGLIP